MDTTTTSGHYGSGQAAATALVLAHLEHPDDLVELTVEGSPEDVHVVLVELARWTAGVFLEFACDGDEIKALSVMRGLVAQAAAAEVLEGAVATIASEMGEVGSGGC